MKYDGCVDIAEKKYRTAKSNNDPAVETLKMRWKSICEIRANTKNKLDELVDKCETLNKKLDKLNGN